ncbi:Pyruvate decarboxylase [Cyphellophora attinorum]|uniref:Pyruvate decarboxylase n=1 Tax=Cyphellophora attinorum TaxID=1664694 RepID=A0A0N0NP19_9EURO|nr:Pyruvate decarboxylase [Phialophora attinorum]KPI42241.1 Pyruvate decarboxylase [Phialophora attinorum]
MTETVKIAEYLFTRLRQLGVGSIHGVPGDYNLTLLDYVEPSGIHWVGNCNELNAGYAADGYAKVNGIGALITTFGVGELSAINAIAGAYTERAPLVHIVGTPVRDSQDNRRLIHHTFNDGEYGRFALMAAQVTVPVDLVSVAVSSERLKTPLKVPHGVHVPSHDDAFAQIFDKIHSAKQPAILVDGEIRALNIIQEVSKLVESTKWPTWTTTYAKSLVDESLPNVHGIYQGAFSPQKAQDFWNSCDLILCFGPHYSNTNTYAYTSIPKAAITISFSDTDIKLGADTVFRDLPAKHALKHLLKLDYNKIHNYDPYPSIPSPELVTSSNVDNAAALTQSTLWPLLAKFLQPGDIIFGETGTAGYGCRVMPIPKHARLFTPVTWLSIGYMLPAAQGAALAQRELLAKSKWGAPDQTTARTILLIGDGSFQMTAQELSTIIRENLNVVVFLINNDGYTIERCIHGLKQGYNDIAFWRYLQVPAAFGAKEGTYAKSAKTPGELEAILGDEELVSGKGLRMVEIVLDREDAPAGILTKMIDTQKEIEAKKGKEGVNGTAK